MIIEKTIHNITDKLTGFEIKMAILELLVRGRPLNKFNMIGHFPLEGDLGRKLKRRFDDEERVLVGESIEQLRHAGLIRPTYKDFFNPEDCFEITDSGRHALEVCALDDLDAALRTVHAGLCELRHGASSALVAEQPDSLRQAAHSTRELIRQVLDLLAPDDEIRAQPNFQPSSHSKGGITRKMRIRHILRKRPSGLSANDADIVETLCELVDQLYNELSSEAHRDIRHKKDDVQDLIQMTDTALPRLLL